MADGEGTTPSDVALGAFAAAAALYLTTKAI